LDAVHRKSGVFRFHRRFRATERVLFAGVGASRIRVATAVAVASILGLSAVPARAQGVDETCVLALTKFDPATVNVAFPDDSARYWLGVYQAVPGTRIRLTGRFAHARYISYNVYDQAQRPLDALADVELVPNAGSVNPFVAGADRTAPSRSYTAFIDFGKIPAHRAPNTLYTGTGQNGLPNYNGSFIYRLYVPDAGTSETGGVGLPTARIERKGAQPGAPSPCTNTEKPSVGGINELLANQEGIGSSSGPVPALFDRNPPKWRKFTNLPASVADSLTDSDLADPLFQAQRKLDLQHVGGSGGFLSNKHNAYLTAGLNKAFGPVAVARLRAPGFPDTRSGTPVMPAAPLRYWSLCSNDPATQRFIGCVNDDRAAVGADGFVTLVVSTPANRPSNATAACGVNWLPWGPNARDVLIYRHMLPDPAFTQAIQFATFEHEAATMGDYFPVSHYETKAGFEATGC
jgi:hypothetical protein